MAAPGPIATPGIWFAFDPDFIRIHTKSSCCSVPVKSIPAENHRSGTDMPD